MPPVLDINIGLRIMAINNRVYPFDLLRAIYTPGGNGLQDRDMKNQKRA